MDSQLIFLPFYEFLPRFASDAGLLDHSTVHALWLLPANLPDVRRDPP